MKHKWLVFARRPMWAVFIYQSLTISHDALPWVTLVDSITITAQQLPPLLHHHHHHDHHLITTVITAAALQQSTQHPRTVVEDHGVAGDGVKTLWDWMAVGRLFRCWRMVMVVEMNRFVDRGRKLWEDEQHSSLPPPSPTPKGRTGCWRCIWM